MWRLSPRISKTAQASYRCVEVYGRKPSLSTTACNYDVTKQTAESAPAAENVTVASPPPPPPRKSGGLLWKLIGVSLVGAGGVVAYAWYDSGFRRTLEDQVPYSKDALSYVFQYLPATPDSGVPAISGTKPIASLATPGSLAKDEQVKIGSTTSSLSPEELEKLEAEEKKRLEAEKLELTIKLREAVEAAENRELESKLERLLEESVRSVESASTSLAAATATVKEHTQELRRAMDKASGADNEWQILSEVRALNSGVVWAADLAAERAKSELDRVQSAVSDGKSKSSTQKNKALIAAEERFNKLNYELSSAVAQLSRAQSEAKVVAEYQTLVRRGREQFRKELESIVPDVKITQRLQDGQLTEDELNSLIAHAHRRIEQLQRQLGEQQSAEEQRLGSALDRLKDEDKTLAAERIEREKERMRAELSITKQKWEEESRVQFEREMRAQLSRQAAAHSDHLTEVIRVQQQELQAAFDVRLAGRLDVERVGFQQQVAGWIARMRGIDKALGDRAESDKIARKAQELWLACQTLQSVINDGLPDANTWEERLKPLKPELDAVAAAVVAADAAEPHIVATIISTFPETAVSRGVWTEAALVERFERVRTVARRVAFIDEAGATLFGYFLSYAMSLFVVSGAPRDPEAPVSDLSPFALLDRAAFSLERGDLEQAVRYVNQLTGEPRRIAADWLLEARLLLEARQAADALTTYAIATGFKSLV